MVDGPNVYEYVANNPIRHVDISGRALAVICVGGAILIYGTWKKQDAIADFLVDGRKKNEMIQDHADNLTDEQYWDASRDLALDVMDAAPGMAGKAASDPISSAAVPNLNPSNVLRNGNELLGDEVGDRTVKGALNGVSEASCNKGFFSRAWDTIKSWFG